MERNAKFDPMLLGFAQQVTRESHGNIDALLDVFFGFMRRKTDFFVGQSEPGLARAAILRALAKQEAMVEKDIAARNAEAAKKKAAAAERRAAKEAKARAAAEAAAAKKKSEDVGLAEGGGGGCTIEVLDEDAAEEDALAQV